MDSHCFFKGAHVLAHVVPAVVTLVTEQDWERHRKVSSLPLRLTSLRKESSRLTNTLLAKDDPLGSHHVWGESATTRRGEDSTAD